MRREATRTASQPATRNPRVEKEKWDIALRFHRNIVVSVLCCGEVSPLYQGVCVCVSVSDSEKKELMMMMMMAGVLDWLADPSNVARFQKLCGVELIPDSVNTCDGDRRPEAANHVRYAGRRDRDDSGSDNRYSAGGTARQRNAHQNNNNNNSEKSSCNGVAARNGHVQGKCKDAVSNGNAFPAPSQNENDIDTPTGGSSTRLCTYSGGDFISDRAASDAATKTDPTTTTPSGTKGTPSSETDRIKNGHCPPSNHPAASTPSSNLGRPGKIPTRISIRYRPLYYLAQIGATLGNEEFYLTVLPFVLWAVDSAVIRQTAMVWCLVMYLGQATKDYLRWPRPPSPPVIRLESQHLQEFSMPSTHAMAGTAIPLLLARMLLERYQLPVLPVLAVAALWCGTTCLSRLYLGVHTILDIVCGILYALAIYAAFSPLTARYDHYQQTHPLAPLVLMATSLALCTICYPSRDKNSAQGDAVQITSVLVGVGVGAWLNYQLGLSVETPVPTGLPIHMPTLHWLGVSVLQFVFGVVVVFALKTVVKFASVRFFSAFFGLDRVDAQHPNVMIGYKYTTYLTLGLIISFLNPLLFTLVGIGRASYYLEIV